MKPKAQVEYRAKKHKAEADGNAGTTRIFEVV